MEAGSYAPEQAVLETVRHRRAELRRSMSALEHALAAPVTDHDEDWLCQVRDALGGLRAELRDHVEVTEGPEGLYAELLASAPRLSGSVRRLTAEHALLTEQLSAVERAAHLPGAGVDAVRDLGTGLLVTLMRHRQRGSDLIYEAYQVDIGGET